MWIGVSVETSRYAFRIDHLRTVGAAVRFISAEPLLGPLPDPNLSGIHWPIAGGESGPRARSIQCWKASSRISDTEHTRWTLSSAAARLRAQGLLPSTGAHSSTGRLNSRV